MQIENLIRNLNDKIIRCNKCRLAETRTTSLCGEGHLHAELMPIAQAEIKLLPFLTRRMWHVLWPEQPADKVTIDHITNGIHVSTWAEPKMMFLFNKYLGPDWLEKHDDPSILILGFARRFATYKRANLIFCDRSRLKNIFNNPWRPVQIIFAGKAHPADMPGKRVLQEVFNSDDGIPHNWVRVMKESIKNCGPIFSARRMVKEYVQKFYTTALKPAEIN